LSPSETTRTYDNGNSFEPGNIVAQTRRIFEKFSLILQSVGGDLSNIVETTDYFLSLEDYTKTASLRRELFKGPPWPAATGVIVAGLIREGALIEIKGIAAL
jgi:enamine deaminase RidA (YjgF/YER057c/UK114 family)